MWELEKKITIAKFIHPNLFLNKCQHSKILNKSAVNSKFAYRFKFSGAEGFGNLLIGSQDKKVNLTSQYIFLETQQMGIFQRSLSFILSYFLLRDFFHPW